MYILMLSVQFSWLQGKNKVSQNWMKVNEHDIKHSGAPLNIWQDVLS